jgi:hypothetical protein
MLLFLLGVLVGIVLTVGGIFGILHIGDLNERRQEDIDNKINKLHE